MPTDDDVTSRAAETIPWKPILKVICLTVTSLPVALAAVQGFTIAPEAAAVLVVLNLIATHVMGELQPGYSQQQRQGIPTAEEIAREQIRLLREERAERSVSRG